MYSLFSLSFFIFSILELSIHGLSVERPWTLQKMVTYFVMGRKTEETNSGFQVKSHADLMYDVEKLLFRFEKEGNI